MSIFTGAQHKGAMREHAAMLRAEAERRNESAGASRRTCGHVHGRTGRVCES